jgi:hypothetical protein
MADERRFDLSLMQLTSFVGRDAELTRLRELLAEDRVVTLTVAGGVGKSRLGDPGRGPASRRVRRRVWYVDLAPIIDPELAPVNDTGYDPGRGVIRVVEPGGFIDVIFHVISPVVSV